MPRVSLAPSKAVDQTALRKFIWPGRVYRFNWAWAPAAVFFAARVWIDHGPLVALAAVAGSLCLGFYLEIRGRKRRAIT